MTHKIVQLKHEYPDDYIRKLISQGVQPEESDFDVELLITEHCTVLKPNGEVLLKFLPRALDLDYATTAFAEFESADLSDTKDSTRPAIASSANKGSEGILGFMDPVHTASISAVQLRLPRRTWRALRRVFRSSAQLVN